MLYVLFANRKTPVKATVRIMKEGVVQVQTEEETADNISGFRCYLDEQLTRMVGDYSEYRTKYRDTDERGMYLSTGEVYVAPPAPPEPEPEPEPTPEEIAERERHAHIAEINMQISGLKAQIDATDYRIIKAYEYSLVGLETEYDLTALHEERQALRDQINELEKTLAEIAGSEENSDISN